MSLYQAMLMCWAFYVWNFFVWPHNAEQQLLIVHKFWIINLVSYLCGKVEDTSCFYEKFMFLLVVNNRICKLEDV